MNTLKNLTDSAKNMFRVLMNINAGKKFPKSGNVKKLKILGNGKSLNNNALSVDCEADYMVVNRHVLADNYQKIKPKFYILADSHFFEHHEGIDIVNKINERTKWPMYLCLVFSRKNKKAINKISFSPNIKVLFYNSNTVNQSSRFSSFAYKHQLGMPKMQNVMVASIMLGLLMKYSVIELYGVEHNWLANLYVGEDNLVYLKNEHFYDKNQVKPKPQKEIQHMEEYPLYLNIQHYARMFQSYWEIKKYIETSDIKTEIINMTKGSFIDAFKRK